MSYPLNLDWVTDSNRAFIASRRHACEFPGAFSDDMRELAKRYRLLAAECVAALTSLEQESTKLHTIDQALRNSQRGYDPVTMAAAVFHALDIAPDADLAHTVRRIINRNLVDTNFNRMAAEVTAAVEGAA